MKTLLTLSRWIDRANDRIGLALSWLTLVMVLLGVYNATTRKLSQVLGVDLSSNTYIEAQWYLYSLVFLWAAAYALRHNIHVRVDIVFERLGLRARAWVDLLGTLLFLVPFCLLMLWVSLPYVTASWSILEQSPDPGGLPRYLIKSAIPIAFGLLLLQAFSQAVRLVAVLRGLDSGATLYRKPDAEL